jgi:putative hydrolase of the HAD superfamily
MKTLIWDFDGTLGFRDGMWTGTILQVLDAHVPGHRIGRDDIRPHLQSGFPWHDWQTIRPMNLSPEAWWNRLDSVFVAAFQQGAGLDPDTSVRLAKRVRSLYLDARYWHLFDDVLPCLDALDSAGWTHFILSNHVPELDELIAALGLKTRFAKVFNSAKTGVEKPHPSAFRNVLDASSRAELVVMIGDSMKADIAGARAVGIPAVLVRKCGDTCAYSCEDLNGLPDILAAIERVAAANGIERRG